MSVADRDSADHQRTVAEALVGAGRWDSALATLGPALAAHPEDAPLLGLMLRTLRALGRRRDAVDAAQHLLTLTPNDPYALRLATLVLLDVGWSDEAIGIAERAVAADPGNSANYLVLARAWASSQRHGALPRQLAAAREAIALDPASPDAHVQIGVALAADGDADAARAAYLEALRLAPQHSAALNNLAVLDLAAGDPADAARHLAAALAADPSGSTALHNLDAVTLRVVMRAGWWMLLAPVPALLASAAGFIWASRALAVAAVLGLPLVARRWWGALTPGQRHHVMSMRARVRARSWFVPGLAATLGTAALLVASTTSVDRRVAGGYLVIAGYAALIGMIGLVARSQNGSARVPRAERLRRILDQPPER